MDTPMTMFHPLASAAGMPRFTFRHAVIDVDRPGGAMADLILCREGEAKQKPIVSVVPGGSWFKVRRRKWIVSWTEIWMEVDGDGEK